MTIAEFLKEEQSHRKQKKWWIFSGTVTNDHGKDVAVQIKSYGFYNQIFRIGDGIDYASGHTIEKVKGMQEHINKVINKFS